MPFTIHTILHVSKMNRSGLSPTLPARRSLHDEWQSTAQLSTTDVTTLRSRDVGEMPRPDSRCEQSARSTLLTAGDKQEDAETYTPRRLSLYSRFLLWADKWWLWETLACFLASSCLVAIVVVLVVAHGDPVAVWEFGSFTLNSIVALLSTIMRVALMVPIAGAIGQQKWLWFQTRQPGRASSNPLEDMELIDSASRGPWGGLILLTRRFGLFVPLTTFDWSIINDGTDTLAHLEPSLVLCLWVWAHSHRLWLPPDSEW